MKIVVIGGNGTIGSAVVEAFAQEHEVIKVGKSSGDVTVDITDTESIKAAFAKIGTVDAVISATGDVAFNLFADMTEQEWQLGLGSKLMGQINLTREVLPYLAPGGSVTLTSGILTDEPIAMGTSATVINAGVEHFAQAVSTELPNGIRINVVSPTVLEESLPVYGDFFKGFPAAPAKRVAQAYVRSVMGVVTGRVFKVL